MSSILVTGGLGVVGGHLVRILRERGHELGGVRLDSGDLAELSVAARQLLDASGFPKAEIVASNDLDEHAIEELKRRGAAISVWGVGTRLATAHDDPALGGVFKLGAVRDGAGVVGAAGDSEPAQALLGKTVGVIGGAMYSQYRAVKTGQCVRLLLAFTLFGLVVILPLQFFQVESRAGRGRFNF